MTGIGDNVDRIFRMSGLYRIILNIRKGRKFYNGKIGDYV